MGSLQILKVDHSLVQEFTEILEHRHFNRLCDSIKKFKGSNCRFSCGSHKVSNLVYILNAVI